MGKRARRRARGADGHASTQRPRPTVHQERTEGQGPTADQGPTQRHPSVDYADPEGSVLTLRQSLSAGTIGKIGEPPSSSAASREDAWQRRSEMLFERLAVRWEVAGLPLTEPAELLGRYRMADGETQHWIRQTIDEHLERHIPELR